MALEIERKYLLVEAPDLAALEAAGPVETIELTQVYLEGHGDIERRCRRSVRDGVTTYTFTEKRPTGDATVRHEYEYVVSEAVWGDAVAAAVAALTKTRRVFTFDGQLFELDEIHRPQRAWLLEIELGSVDVEVRLPPFVNVAREVTDDPAWRNAAIAAGCAHSEWTSLVCPDTTTPADT